MIVAAAAGELLLVTQTDHARLAGELLALWHADGLPQHPRRDELIFAACEHDNGWREEDAAPRWHARRGLPHDFLSLPRRERIEIWKRGTRRYAAQRPYAALLITRHALNLFGKRRREEGWRTFLEELEDRERGLLEETRISPQVLAADYRWIDLGDQISLAACSHWREPVERHGVRIAPANGTVGLAPFPLAGTTSFRVPCRRIPRRDYQGDADLGGELAAARWEEMVVRIAELNPPA